MGRARNQSQAISLEGFDAVMGSHRGDGNKTARIFASGNAEEIAREISRLAKALREGKSHEIIRLLSSQCQVDSKHVNDLFDIFSKHIISKEESAEGKQVQDTVINTTGIQWMSSRSVLSPDKSIQHIIKHTMMDHNGETIETTLCGHNEKEVSQSTKANVWHVQPYRNCGQCAYLLEKMKADTPERYRSLVSNWLEEDGAGERLHEQRVASVKERIVDHFKKGNEALPQQKQAEIAEASYWHGLGALVEKRVKETPHKTISRLYGDEGSQFLVSVHNIITASKGVIDHKEMEKYQSQLLTGKDFAVLCARIARQYREGVTQDGQIGNESFDRIALKFQADSLQMLKNNRTMIQRMNS